jgi:hypothetical protein
VWISSAAAVIVIGLILLVNQTNKDNVEYAKSVIRPTPTQEKIEPQSSQFTAPTLDMESASKPDITSPPQVLDKGVTRKAMVAVESRKEAADMYAATVSGRVANETISEPEQPSFAPASAIELVTLPRRENVQLTIYNSTSQISVLQQRGLREIPEPQNIGGLGSGFMEGNSGDLGYVQTRQFNNRSAGLKMVIQETIDPDSWFDISDTGKATLEIYDNKLVVRQTRENHQQIEKLLQDLNGPFGKQINSSISRRDRNTEHPIYKQIEQFVDLSDLKPEMSFREAIEKLENSVRPPIQIRPNWRDLRENAEVEPTTPARMGPLRGIKLHKALEILISGVTSSQLGEFGELTYVVDEGVVLIGTVDMLPPKMETCVYDISGLYGHVDIAGNISESAVAETKKLNINRSAVSRTPIQVLPNSLTLVRERRNLTMKKGWNWLQFMWANTLIDPTSLSLEPLAQADKIDIQQLVFPARLRELGRWLIHSDVSGQVPFEITYFTSGLSWRAFYMGTLAENEKTMQLQGYVRVANNSGEDYEDAQTRLIVGNVHILDQIAELAQRRYPYNRPIGLRERHVGVMMDGPMMGGMKGMGGYGGGMMGGRMGIAGNLDKLSRKEIVKEGLSEYFLYTIEGTETIANQWGKRLLSFDIKDIEIESLYKYDEQRWRNRTIRFVKFTNDEEHNLGQTPIPNGNVKIYGNADNEGHLSYVGGTNIKYIPVNEEVELNLGQARLVKVEPKLMHFKTDNYKFNRRGNVAGWDEIRTWKVEIINTRELPIEIEVTRGFNTTYWTIKTDAPYEKHDATHARFKLNLEPKRKLAFEYTVTTYHGTRANTLAERN